MVRDVQLSSSQVYLSPSVGRSSLIYHDFLFFFFIEDFMLCKAENRDPGHCLKEGRKVTRCATDLCV